MLTSSGEPSATPSIRLHGAGSLGAGSTPLIVLDGFPIDSGSLVSMNPEDFEDITVLKDASATAIYGSRAANGVVYITSKKGRRGKDPVINLSSQHGFTYLANKDYFTNFLNTQQLTDFWVETGYRTQEQVNAILEEYPNDTQWYEYYYNEGAPTTQLNLNVSGGGEHSTYYISGGYFTQEGMAYRSGFDRYTLRSNLTTDIKDWIQVGLNLSLGYDERQTNPYGSNSTNRGLALLAQPFYSPINPETGRRYEGVIPGWNRYDPQYLADNNPSLGTNVQLNPSGFIQLQPFKGLTLRTQAGVEFYDYTISTQRLPSYVGSLNFGSSSEEFRRGLTKTITNTIEYKFDLGVVNNFSILGGQEYIDFDYERFLGSSAGQSDDRLILLGQGPESISVEQDRAEYVFTSYFGRLTYDYNKKYYVDFTARRDGSSRFGAENRYADFWAIGAMWKAKNESFLQDVNWLGELTFRASHGTSGNADIGNYNSLALVGTNQYNGQNRWALSTPGNPALSWENQTKTTLGVNMNLFQRLNLDVELYNRVTEDMLIDVPYPYTTGFDEVTSNVGSLKNSGIDVTLDFNLFTNQDFYVTPYLNFNYNRNEVTELFQDKDYWIIPNTGVSWAIGQPVSFFYPVFAGVDSETGDAQWYVPNEDPDQIINPNLDPNNVTTTFNSANLQQNTGIKRYAPLNGGFGLNAGYKGFYMQAAFTFSEGKHLINNDRYFFENPSVFGGFNQSTAVLDYWKEPGDQTQFPRYGVQFTQFDSRLIEDASFIRLKTLSLGYNLPRELVQTVGLIDGLKLYVVGRNLLTWTEYSGPDPEIDSNLTLGVNPNTKQFTMGVDIAF
ncbi:SusC/RagA family TonB-linked outer membrane protein [Antarcticibacterium sp. 1MA-6-2]|uniref:SusC/RagA family TonB-linked outer membrane protein n=1 Tax=Antarcticibacterium sp. 1MA-6-2 TaxID=2908210 RepID=UPI001F185B35|nr:SusC/RagA family TonB-linked outer membrane protein [Antarcticibacterium sp. 1MA-6-2]UJH92979.1 SusC/RagA family TonB-linked outer membrane protein [Antarcticibacterium sp. 1MA-6-2]